MRTVVVLFTRDLRVHDHPALAMACSTADRVVPLFVHDTSLGVPPNRARFLQECLIDLQSSLQRLGGDLMIRSGDPVEETMRVAHQFGAVGIAMSQDVSGYARARESRLERACRQAGMVLRLCPGVTVVPAGEVVPTTGGDHYKVFTPYYRAWQSRRWRPVAATPARIVTPPDLASPLSAPARRGSNTASSRRTSSSAAPAVPSSAPADSARTAPASAAPRRADSAPSGMRPDGPASVAPAPGGETAALARLGTWLPSAHDYEAGHDDLAGDRTSRLSPYLHFGCLSPLYLATQEVPDAFIRQLCWRDFYHQVLAAFPALRTKAYRPGAADTWADDEAALTAWQQGETGVSIVDAGMRQLMAEGWMHNRARMITASYLTKIMGLDWRAGAEWFDRWLIDADVANNYGNWQWVAGTGNDSKPYRRFNPQRQAERFDPDQSYVRRYQ